MNDNYDFELDSSGKLAISNGSESIKNLITMQVASNNNFALTEDLGINWINETNSGILQIKDNEDDIVRNLATKINTIEGVRDVVSMTLNPLSDRSLTISIVVLTSEGDITEVEVSL